MPNFVVVKCAVALASSIFLAFVFCWTSWTFETSPLDDQFLNFMSGFVPFFAAIGLGFSLPRLQHLSYALLGALAGFVGFIQVLLLHSAYSSGQLSPRPILLLCTYLLSGIMSFLAGGSIGERIRGRAVYQKPSGPVSTLIKRLLRDPATAAQVTTVIQTIAPILLTILNAIFMAAGLAKGPPSGR